MENVFIIVALVIHFLTLMDALRNLRGRHGGFRVVLAIFPPLLGPIIYFITKNAKNQVSRKRSFMEGKARFSRRKRQ